MFFAASHFTWAPHSSSNIPCSAVFSHLRTLFIFCLSHNHLTPNHISPSPLFCEELCRSFYWYLTLSALEYPQCHCTHMHPPWPAAWRTGHKPSSLRCSIRSPSSRFQTFSEKTSGCPRAPQNIPHGHCSQLFSFIWSFMCNAIEVLCCFSSLILYNVVERIRVKDTWRVLLSDQLVLESGRWEQCWGDEVDFLLTNLKKQKFRESGDNQKQEGRGAALANLLPRCTIHTYSVFIQ